MSNCNTNRLAAISFLLALASAPLHAEEKNASGKWDAVREKLYAEPVEGKDAKFVEISLEQQASMAKLRDARRAKARDPNWRQQRPAIEWIHTAYHGEIFDGNLEQVEMDAKTIGEMEDSLFQILEKHISRQDSNGAFGDDLFTKYEKLQYAGLDLLTARYYILEDLIGAAPDEIQARYLWRMGLLERDLRLEIGRTAWQLTPEIARLVREGLFRYPAPGQRYLDACREKGVPVPPTFPSAGWRLQGELAFTFISVGRLTEVYAYKDESEETPGTCVALPRSASGQPKHSAGGNASLIGVICQSSRVVDGTQHACFWDNVGQTDSGEGSARLNGQSQPMRFGYVTDGFSLRENCTLCHRGNNVFNIHPGTALDLWNAPAARGGPFPVGASWYTPIGGAGYANPPPAVLADPPPAEAQRMCTGCHQIGALSPGYYCDVVADAAHLTMPPLYARETGEGAAGWPDSRSPHRYRSHITQLRARCPTAASDVSRGPTLSEYLTTLAGFPIYWRP